jgi:hypothetical protein
MPPLPLMKATKTLNTKKKEIAPMINAFFTFFDCWFCGILGGEEPKSGNSAEEDMASMIT